MHFWNIQSVIGFFLSDPDGRYCQCHGKESSDTQPYQSMVMQKPGPRAASCNAGYRSPFMKLCSA